MEKTIAALSTPLAAGGIAMIRISGKEAIQIAETIFQTKSSKPLSSLKGYRASFGSILKDGEHIDEGIATVYRAPKSYTGEDVVEISCHGGLFISQQVLRSVFDAGAVPAQAGEFTKRAFVNGKMDLTQAEAVMDMIMASNENAVKMAAVSMEGSLYNALCQMKEELLNIAAHLNAWADYPEEDIEEVETNKLLEQLLEIDRTLKRYLETYDLGKILRDGIETVIIGKPNTGKSTLMNLLVGYEKSIVTEIAGTTRDIVEERVNIGDVVLNLSDTAGIRDTENTVEKIGVELAYKQIDKSALALVVFDNGDKLTKEDKALIERAKDLQSVAVINKTDLDKQLDTQYVENKFKHVVYISAKEKEGIDKLREKVRQVLKLENIQAQDPILANERQRNCALSAKKAMEESIEALKAGFTLDAATVCIENGIDSLLELTGERVTDSMAEHVFARFCVGK